MEEIHFQYEMTPELFKEGAKLSGQYTISPNRRALIYVLCAVIAVNSVYSMISAGKLIRGQIIFLLIAVGIAFYVTFGTKIQLNNLIKRSLKTGMNEVTLSPKKITVNIEGKVTEIEKNSYVGFKENEKVYLVFFKNHYAILPKEGKTREELLKATEILKNYRKTVEPPPPEFPVFNAETATCDEEYKEECAEEYNKAVEDEKILKDEREFKSKENSENSANGDNQETPDVNTEAEKP